MASGRGTASSGWKDDRQWRVGTDEDVAWIREGTRTGLSITSAIPPVFEAYATILVPDTYEARSRQGRVIERLLREQSGEQPWWLGYLETGWDDVVFPDVPRVTLYANWLYVLVQAAPEEALRWRSGRESWRAPGPDLVFPADRSWLLSRLWDDDWRCLGGESALVARFADEPELLARRVGLDEDATPPGHVAR